MIYENETSQNKILNLVKEPIGLRLEQGTKLLEIVGNISLLAQNLEEEGTKIVQQLEYKEKINEDTIRAFAENEMKK